MSPGPDGNELQLQAAMAGIADTAIERFAARLPAKAEIPAPLKWASAILAALFTAGVIGVAFWLVSTVNGMQVTLAEVSIRLEGQQTVQEGRMAEFDRRITKLETHMSGAAK